METAIVKLYTNVNNEIEHFLSHFFSNRDDIEKIGIYSEDKLEWQKKYQNPVELVDIIGTFIENNDKYHINMWISLDTNCFINITESNVDQIIKYIYERYPW